MIKTSSLINDVIPCKYCGGYPSLAQTEVQGDIFGVLFCNAEGGCKNKFITKAYDNFSDVAHEWNDSNVDYEISDKEQK